MSTSQSRDPDEEPEVSPRGRTDSETRVRDPGNALAWAAIAGDGGALEALLEMLAPGLLGVVRAVLGASHPDRDDVLQDCLIAVVDALPAFEGRSTVARYASRIALRLCLERRKRARVREQRFTLVPELDSIAADAEDADASRRREALRALLDELPVVQAETFAMRICLGLSLEEISETTGAPINTVRSRVRLARESLRHRIESDRDLAELLGGAP